MTEETQVDHEETVETVEAPVKVEKPHKEPIIRDSNDAIKQLRKENERLRKTLDETSTKRAEELADHKLAALRTEVEAKAKQEAESLLEQRLAKMEEDTRTRLVKSELKAAAIRQGVVDFDDLYEVMKKSDLKLVEFDDDGEVRNAQEVVSNFKQKKSHFFADVSTASSARAPMSRETPPVEKTALNMSKDEYEKAKVRLARM